MTHPKLQIAVVGAGIGGLTAGAMLARDGHGVTVFERAPEPGSVGAGLLLQPTGMGVLRELTLADRVASLSSPVTRLLGTNAARRTVMDLSYSDLEPGLVGFGIHRSALHAVLLACAIDAGVCVRHGCGVDSIREMSGKRALDLENGITDGPFDLVIIANGARSALRHHAGAVRRDRKYAWGALWFVATNPPDSMRSTLRQVYDGTHTMLGFLPSGRPGKGPGAPELLSMFWSIKADEWASGAFAFDAWKARCIGLLPEAAAVFDQIRSTSDLIFAPYFDVRVTQTDPRTVAIGDAAHATSPQLGQGANLAMLDAQSLAGAIRAERSVGDAIVRHARDRRRQTRYYRSVSRWLTPVFQSDMGLLGAWRDATLGPMCRFPPARRQMLLTLAGVKTGVLGEMPLGETGPVRAPACG